MSPHEPISESYKLSLFSSIFLFAIKEKPLET